MEETIISNLIQLGKPLEIGTEMDKSRCTE